MLNCLRGVKKKKREAFSKYFLFGFIDCYRELLKRGSKNRTQ